MIMVGANSVLTTKVISENTRKRFTEVAVAVEEIGNSMTLTLKALSLIHIYSVNSCRQHSFTGSLQTKTPVSLLSL